MNTSEITTKGGITLRQQTTLDGLTSGVYVADVTTIDGREALASFEHGKWFYVEIQTRSLDGSGDWVRAFPRDAMKTTHDTAEAALAELDRLIRSSR